MKHLACIKHIVGHYYCSFQVLSYYSTYCLMQGR